MKRKILFICLVILVVGVVVFILSSRTSRVEIAEVIVQQVEAKKLANEEIVWNLLEANGLTLLEKIDAMIIIRCESRYDQFAINYNADSKSYDTGIWQINGKYHPEISRSCSFDIECATKEALKIYKQDGSWKQWSCNRI